MSEFNETRGLLTALWKELKAFKREQPKEYLFTKRFNLFLVLPMILADFGILHVLGYGWLGMISAIVFGIAGAAITIPIFMRFFHYQSGADLK
jgi:hypothetical protein